MQVTLIDANTHAMQSMVDAIGICRNKKCSLDTIEKALDAKPVPHLSVLEFGWAMVLVEGLSMKARVQADRHRIFGQFHSPIERSTRSIDMSLEDVVIPETVKDKEQFFIDLSETMIKYHNALNRGEAEEDAAYQLPLAITTKFYLAGNIRTWYEYFQKRLCKKHVQDEHYRLAVQMWELLQTEFPILRKAHPCKNCGKCQEEK